MSKLQVITASTRPGRIGPSITHWFTNLARNHAAFDVGVTDLGELNLPFLDEPEHPSLGRYTKPHTIAWSAIVARADALVFVMPEYNNGFNAPLKNAIDFLYSEWRYKPVGFVSYGGVSGGTRAVQLLKPVLLTLKMTPIGESVPIPFVSKLMEHGALQPTEAMNDSGIAMLNELARIQEALAPLRHKVLAPTP